MESMFQSTPPRGRRRRLHLDKDRLSKFQSTPPRGRRLVEHQGVVLPFVFQSTPPRGRRPGVVQVDRAFQIVSIHASAWEATVRSLRPDSHLLRNGVLANPCDRRCLDRSWDAGRTSYCHDTKPLRRLRTLRGFYGRSRFAHGRLIPGCIVKGAVPVRRRMLSAVAGRSMLRPQAAHRPIRKRAMHASPLRAASFGPSYMSAF